MPLVVVGSVALDSVETPTESAKRARRLGRLFLLRRQLLHPVRLAGVVGEDWPAEHTGMLQSRGSIRPASRSLPGGKTFRWRGRYLPNMNDRETLDLQLNVLEQFNPVLPETYRRCKYLFLANGSPRMQMKVLDQCPGAALTVADTMDHWIHTERDELLAAPEADRRPGAQRQRGEAPDRRRKPGARRPCGPRMGPRFVVIKKGEHGAMFFSQHETYVLPAYPTPKVVDPTGAGDSFAGGMMGYLAEQGNFDPKTLKEAMAYGMVVASFTVEDFSLDRLRQIDRDDIDERMAEYRRMLSF